VGTGELKKHCMSWEMMKGVEEAEKGRKF